VGIELIVRRSTSIWLIVSSMTLIALMGTVHLTDDAGSSSGGITGKTETGCTCHSPTSSGEVTPRIDGLPSTYEPGKVYDLDLSYVGPPPGSGFARAGFNLRVEGGTLMIPDAVTSVRIGTSGKEATHSSTGNREITWQVQWKAPDEGEGDIDATLVVNVVNGDGSPGPSDKWGRTRVTVEGEGGNTTILLVVLLVVAAIMGLIFVISKRSPSKPKKRPRRKGGRRQSRRKR
jgi:hypothetical protein